MNVHTRDGFTFVKCSCGQNPVPTIWRDEHWQGDPAAGEAALRSVIARQAGTPGAGRLALAALLCRVIGHRHVVTRTAGGNPRVTCPRCRSRLLYVSGGVIWVPEWR